MICRNCGAGLEADRIDSSLGIVTCSHCGSLHNIPMDSIKRSSTDNVSEPAVKPERVEVALPSRFDVQRDSGSMQISWPVGRLFHGFVLLGMAGAVAHMAVTSGMLLLLIASAGLAYFAAVRAFNKHHIRIDGARLQVRQLPLPWPGTHQINASDVTQLYATEHKSRTQTGDGATRKTRIRKYYRLSAITDDNRRVVILGGLADPLQALWLEQEIERLLGIVDQPVAGEHG